MAEREPRGLLDALALVDEVRTLRLLPNDRIFVRVKATEPEYLGLISDFFKEQFPDHKVVVMTAEIDVSVVREDADPAHLPPALSAGDDDRYKVVPDAGDGQPAITLNDGPGSPQWEAECEEFGCHDDGAAHSDGEADA